MKKLDPSAKKHPGWKHMLKPDRNEVRSERITSRFTPPEKAALEYIATARGECVSDFMRSSIMTAARKYVATEKASLGMNPDVTAPLVKGTSDQYVHRKASRIAPLKEDRYDPVLLDIYRSLQAIGGTVREIYLSLVAGPGYDPSDPVSVEKFDCLASVFSDTLVAIEDYLGLETGGEARIIPPTERGERCTETAEIRAAMEADDDSLEVEI